LTFLTSSLGGGGWGTPQQAGARPPPIRDTQSIT